MSSDEQGTPHYRGSLVVAVLVVDVLVTEVLKSRWTMTLMQARSWPDGGVVGVVVSLTQSISGSR